MMYLCEKRLQIGSVIYYPGDYISDAVLLPQRIPKLLKSQYISEIREMVQTSESLHTLEGRIAEDLQKTMSGKQRTEPKSMTKVQKLKGSDRK